MVKTSFRPSRFGPMDQLCLDDWVFQTLVGGDPVKYFFQQKSITWLAYHD